MDVTVWFLAERHSTRFWDTRISGNFKWDILPGWSFNMKIQRGEKGTLHLNPTLLWRISRGRFDVVVLRGWSSPSYLLAQMICMYFRISTVLWSGSVPGALTYGGKVWEKPIGRRRLFRPLLRWWIQNARGYIAYGTRSRNYLIELGADPSRIHCAWNTVDVDRMILAADSARSKREEMRASLGIAPADKLFLYVGLFQPLKYLDTLIHAYERLTRQRSDVVLGLVGYGECEAELRSQANKIGAGRIMFLGHVDLADLPKYYTAADIFVLPSVDIWGLVVNEAMACGLPIIASDAVGCTDDLVIPCLNGFAYPHGDISALVNAMQYLAENNVLRERMGQASHLRIQDYVYCQAVPALGKAIREARGAKRVSAKESNSDQKTNLKH